VKCRHCGHEGEGSAYTCQRCGRELCLSSQPPSRVAQSSPLRRLTTKAWPFALLFLLLAACATPAVTPPTPPPLPPGATAFALADLQTLRGRANEADRAPHGQEDPARVLAVFPALRLKPGYVLRSTPGEGENAAKVWAEGPDRQRLDVMAGIDGDGTPWSYLSASLFDRQVRELGAVWHGIIWGSVALIDGVPEEPQASSGWQDWLPFLRPTPVPSRWTWRAAKPVDWRPRVQVGADKVTVTFYAYARRMPEGLYQYVDTYRPGSYVGQHSSTLLASGTGGMQP
jgi:hypothetical protein